MIFFDVLERVVSVSVALNAMRRREAGLTAMLWSFSSHDVSQYRARTVVAHFLIGGPDSLGGQSRGRGGNLPPCADMRAKFQNGAFELSFSQRQSRIPSSCCTSIAMSSHWGGP